MKEMIIGVLLVVLLTGCGMTAKQKQQITKFGEATEKISKLAERHFIDVRHDVINLQTEISILSDKNSAKKIDIDAALDLNDIAIRVAAVRALGRYGELLNALANADQTESIKNAATRAVAEFESAFNKDYSEAEKNAITDAVSILGQWIVEDKKKEAIIQIVSLHTVTIDKLASLLYRDLTVQKNSNCHPKERDKLAGKLTSDREYPPQLPTEGKATGVLDIYCDSAKDLKRIAIWYINECPQNPDERPQLPKPSGNLCPTRRLELRDYALQAWSHADQVQVSVWQLAQKGKNVRDQLITANQDLVNILESEDYSTDDIKNYAKNIKELVDLTAIITGLNMEN